MRPQSGYEQAAVYWREKYEYERARREHAEDQLKSLKRDDTLDLKIKAAFGVPPGVASLLAIMVSSPPGHIAKQMIFDLLPKRSDARDVKLVDVLVCKAREALRKHGLGDVITTVWGHGYALSHAGRDAINAHINAHRQPSTFTKINEDEDCFNNLATFDRQPTTKQKQRAVG